VLKHTPSPIPETRQPRTVWNQIPIERGDTQASPLMQSMHAQQMPPVSHATTRNRSRAPKPGSDGPSPLNSSRTFFDPHFSTSRSTGLPIESLPHSFTSAHLKRVFLFASIFLSPLWLSDTLPWFAFTCNNSPPGFAMVKANSELGSLSVMLCAVAGACYPLTSVLWKPAVSSMGLNYFRLFFTRTVVRVGACARSLVATNSSDQTGDHGYSLRLSWTTLLLLSGGLPGNLGTIEFLGHSSHSALARPPAHPYSWSIFSASVVNQLLLSICQVLGARWHCVLCGLANPRFNANT